MRVLFLSMPDVTPILLHETAVHLPNHGIASVAGNIDKHHSVYLVDLVRKRRSLRKYLTRLIKRIQPDLIGLSAMTWQFDTCMKIARLLKGLNPEVKIVVGGYHATLMAQQIAESDDAQWLDYIIRGEGEEACRRLVNALAGEDEMNDIPSLSYKEEGTFCHNPRADNLELNTLKLPVRDRRRLTWGYHLIQSKVEVIETSRGCTRSCNFCSMRHMYGRSFRTFPISRVLEDIDDIYYNRKTRSIFITDDNIVLNVARVMELCDAIISRGYKNLRLYVQADCVSMARNPAMVKKMGEAGFRSVFLGIENASAVNLNTAGKGDIAAYTQKAVENCHANGIMVIGGLIFGFPDDSVESIKKNYEYFQALNCDAAYCQILTPYPRTGIREQLQEGQLVTNENEYSRYNGLWANVRTRFLSSEELQYHFWYQRQVVLGWWNPRAELQRQGWAWIALWRYLVRPFMKIHYRRAMKKYGWRGRYQKELDRWENMNRFPELEES